MLCGVFLLSLKIRIAGHDLGPHTEVKAHVLLTESHLSYDTEHHEANSETERPLLEAIFSRMFFSKAPSLRK